MCWHPAAAVSAHWLWLLEVETPFVSEFSALATLEAKFSPDKMQLLASALLVSGSVASVARVSLAKGWPAHRGDAGQTSFAGSMKPRLTMPTKPLWTLTMDQSLADDDTPEVLLSTPVVDDATGTLYYARTVRMGKDELSAVDSTNGAPKWTLNLTGFRDVYGSYPTGVILEDGSVVSSDRAGVYRVAPNGTELWRNVAEDTLSDDVIVTPTGLVITGPLDCSPIDRTGRKGKAAASGSVAGAWKRRSVVNHHSGNDSSNGSDASKENKFTYFAYRVEDGGLAWGITLSSGIADFCSSAMVGPAYGGAGSSSGSVTGRGTSADGALWVTVSTVSDTSYWFGINFNATAAWIATSGDFPQVRRLCKILATAKNCRLSRSAPIPSNVCLYLYIDTAALSLLLLQIGNPDISDWMNVVLPASTMSAAGSSSGSGGVVAAALPTQVLLPYFEGSESCWPDCPPKGLVLAVDPSSGNSTTLPIPAEVCDGIGECGAWSTGVGPSTTIGSSSGDNRRIFALASSGVLFAFAPGELSRPLWTYNASNAAGAGLTDVYVAPVSDAEGNVYIAWGSLLAAVDGTGKELWRFTLPDGGVIISQPAYGSDGRIYVTAVHDGGGTGSGPRFTIAAY